MSQRSCNYSQKSLDLHAILGEVLHVVRLYYRVFKLMMLSALNLFGPCTALHRIKECQQLQQLELINQSLLEKCILGNLSVSVLP